uniref:Uncharacterized protein n=1 Tax=Opuntia streptacantha TaxID=393608 RepID=A0A7C9ERL8_OPUST
MPSKMVHPAPFMKLDHDSINPRIPGSSISPSSKQLTIVIPRDLLAYSVTLHVVKIRSPKSCSVEKVSPQQLSKKRNRWRCMMLDASINFLKALVEMPDR